MVDTNVEMYKQLNQKSADPLGDLVKTQQALRFLGAGQPYRPTGNVTPTGPANSVDLTSPTVGENNANPQ